MSHSLFALNKEPEKILIGCVYTCFSLLIIPFHVVINMAILSTPFLRKNSVYIIMLQINFVDVAQTLIHIITGLFLIFPQIRETLPSFVKFCGGTVNSLWLSLFPLITILSLSRAFALRHMKSTGKKKIMELYLKLLVITGWTFSCGFWLTTCLTQSIEFEGIGWSYDLTKPIAKILYEIEYYVAVPSLCFSYGTYLAIVINMMMTRRGASHIFPVRELTVFLQSTFSTGYFLAMLVLWHKADDWFQMTNFTAALLQCGWIMCSFVNPFLLFTLNRTLRSSVLKMLKIFPPTNPVTQFA